MVADMEQSLSGQQPIPTVVVTGPVGAGKSTTAMEISRLLEEIPVRHAAFDMDYLRWVVPEPDGDPFGSRLGYRNLAAMWGNVRELQPTCVILADVVESPDQAREYETAMPGTRAVVVRLHVPLPELLRRLEGRESPETLEWYRHRAPQLQGIMEREGVGDIVIDVGHRNPTDVARDIIDRTGIGTA